MLALCLMLLVTYHALNYAGIIGLGLSTNGATKAPNLNPQSSISCVHDNFDFIAEGIFLHIQGNKYYISCVN